VGPTLDEKREEIARTRAEEERLLIQRTFDARVTALRKRAQEMEAAGDYAGAMAQWQVVLEFVPDDPEAVAAAATARERLLQEQEAAVRNVENQAVIRTRFATGLDLYNEGDLVGARKEWDAILAIDPENEVRRIIWHARIRIDEAVRACKPTPSA
jgi:tetratricopeptide (TPR) repeat protein